MVQLDTHLSDLDKLIVVVVAIEERLLPEYHSCRRNPSRCLISVKAVVQHLHQAPNHSPPIPPSSLLAPPETEKSYWQTGQFGQTEIGDAKVNSMPCMLIAS